MRKTTKTVKKQKFQEENARRICRSHFKYKLSSENFIYDPLNVFSKPMEAINIWIR